MKIRTLLSLFNGMSIARMSFEDAGIEVEKCCYSSEIDKYANRATDAMFNTKLSFYEWGLKVHYGYIKSEKGDPLATGELDPAYEDEYNLYVDNYNSEISHLGDITKWRDWDIDWSRVDFITGGFPCQSWSMAGKQLGDKDPRGMLFWTMLDIIKHVQHCNPNVDFIIENVRMKKEFESYITTHTENALGTVHKTLINSALVSAQNRNRYYWTSFPVTQPKDEWILLRDIIEYGEVDREKSLVVTTRIAGATAKRYLEKSMHQMVICDKKTIMTDTFRPCELRETKGDGICHHVATATDIKGNESIKRVYADDGKSPTLTTMEGGHRQPKVIVSEVKYRKLTPRECFRLQTVPEHHIETLLNAGISNTQLYKMCGNAFTMKVISHILCCYKKSNN